MTPPLVAFVNTSRIEEVNGRKVRSNDRPPAYGVYALIGLIKLNGPDWIVFAVPV